MQHQPLKGQSAFVTGVVLSGPAATIALAIIANPLPAGRRLDERLG